MARTIAEIKTVIGNAYISQSAVQTRYSLTAEDVALGFDALFSKVSIESLFFYAVAFAINVFEVVMDVFRIEIQTKVDAAFVANQAWWHAQALAFQKGDNLILNTKTFKWEYETINTIKQIVKKVAVRETVQADGACKVKLYLATTLNGSISALTNDDKAIFEIYANQIKPSGVLLQVISGAGDALDFGFTINYNPLLMNSNGELLTDGTKPVELAISNFITTLNDTNFGGKLNITKLIDSIQSATGVVDAKITSFKINDTTQTELWGTYESTNGWFTVGDLNVVYQPQTEL